MPLALVALVTWVWITFCFLCWTFTCPLILVVVGLVAWIRTCLSMFFQLFAISFSPLSRSFSCWISNCMAICYLPLYVYVLYVAVLLLVLSTLSDLWRVSAFAAALLSIYVEHLQLCVSVKFFSTTKLLYSRTCIHSNTLPAQTSTSQRSSRTQVGSCCLWSVCVGR